MDDEVKLAGVKLGDEKTIYSYQDNAVRKHKTVCVGFMGDGQMTPVWYTAVTDPKAFLQRLGLYVAFDGSTFGHSMGYFETAEDVLQYMGSMADMRRVQTEHLLANIAAAREGLHGD